MSAAVFAVVFVPAAAVAFHNASVVGLFVAAQLPLLVLLVLFLHRIHARHFRRWDRLQPPFAVGWCEFDERKIQRAKADAEAAGVASPAEEAPLLSDDVMWGE